MTDVTALLDRVWRSDAAGMLGALTRRLVSVGEIMGIRVLDHVIIGDRRYVSFADQGWLTP